MVTNDRYDEDDDLGQVAPTLHGLKGRSPMRAPEAFFDRFPHAVVSRIAQAEAPTARPDRWRLLVPTIPVLTVLAALLWWNMATNTAPDAATPPAPTLAELEAYAPLDEHLLLEDLEELPEWDRVNAELSQDELLAYIEHSDLELHEVLPYLE